MPTLASSNWFSVPEHDEAALQRLLRRLPSDALRVVISSASWHGYGPTNASGAE